MNIASLATDNITELLFKIIEFTKIRQKILTRNINDMHQADFEPKDLEVDRFSQILNNAITEHVLKGRLILCDTESIKFGPDGHFEVKPITDKNAKKILQNNRDQYLEMQIDKLLENSLNQRLAAELLKQKDQIGKTYDA